MEKELQTKDFRLFLQSELIKRCEKNKNYSLRSFANALRIHHSVLSRILRGERKISRKVFQSIALSLNLNPTEAATFQKELNPKVNLKREYMDLTMDAFNVLSQWYHYAILELMLIKNFRSEPKWVAKKLGITVSEVNAAIERLLRLEMIEVDKKGHWICRAHNTEVGINSPYTTSALKRYQKQILDRAIKAVDEIPRDYRHNISSTVAVDMRDLEKIKKRINEFRRELSQFIQHKNYEPNSVYQLGICFYPLTNLTGENK